MDEKSHSILFKLYSYVQHPTCGLRYPYPGPELSAQRPDNFTNNKNSTAPRCFYQNAKSLKSGNKIREFQETVYVNQYTTS